MNQLKRLGMWQWVASVGLVFVPLCPAVALGSGFLGVRASAYDAEADWAVLDRLLKDGPPPISNAPAAPGEDRVTREVHDLLPLVSYRRQLRDAGLQFYNCYPNDRRRWLWFVLTLKNPTP